MAVGYFSVKGFDKFQHYKDRSPPWIKLYNELLDDYAFGQLPDASKAHLIQIWLLASRSDNKIPWDPSWVGSKINSTEAVDLEILSDTGFIVEWTGGEKSRSEGWGSRYISKEVKALVWERDGGRCTACKSRKNVEYDHIVAVSNGGTSSAENVQLLCRSCNRKKRVRSTCYADAEQVATNTPSSSEPRDRVEERERREESIGRNSKTKLPSDWEKHFDEFKSTYPSRGKATNPVKPAREKFAKLIRDGTDPNQIIAGTRGYAAAMKDLGHAGTERVKQMVTFLNQACWEQYQPGARPNGGNGAAPGPPTTWERAHKEAEYQAQFPGGESDQTTAGAIMALVRAGNLTAADKLGADYLKQRKGAA